MKVLSIANISNFEDINSDSGYIFNYLLAEEFKKNKNEFAIVLPEGLINHQRFKGCRIYYSKIGTTKYSSRFAFEWDSFNKIIEDYKPDLIFLNQCELTSALKSLLISSNNSHIKLLTYCHYPALHVNASGDPILDYSLNNCELCSTIIFNILSAINIADYFVTQSNFAKNLLIKFAEKHNFQLKKCIHVVPPPLDPSLYQKKYKKCSTSNKIIYNHRLYKSYGTEFLENAIDSIKKYDFIILDPMSNRSKNRINLNNSPAEFVEKIKNNYNIKIYNGSTSRQDYKKYLGMGDVGLACYRPACVWSMSAVDCICMGVPVVAPDFASYVEFIPQILRFNSLMEMERIICKLFTDNDFYKKAIQESRKILKDLFPNKIFERFNKIICEG